VGGRLIKGECPNMKPINKFVESIGEF